MQQAEDFLGGGALGIHRHAQPQLFPQEIGFLRVNRVADTGDGMRAAQLPGHHAAKQIGFVCAGHGDHQVAFAHLGGLLHLDAGAVSLQHHYVQPFLYLHQRVLAVVDYQQIVPFPAQLPGQGVADLAFANHYDSHSLLPRK